MCKGKQIEGAGFSLFADCKTEKGQIIELYLEEKTGMPSYTMKPRWKNVELIYCHSFASIKAVKFGICTKASICVR